MSCCVYSCRNSWSNTRDRDVPVVFHKFPRNREKAMLWAAKCRRKHEINCKYARMCSEHFLPSDYADDMEHRLLGLPRRKILKKYAVPSQNLPDEDENEANHPVPEFEGKFKTYPFRYPRAPALNREGSSVVSEEGRAVEISVTSKEYERDASKYLILYNLQCTLANAH